MLLLTETTMMGMAMGTTGTTTTITTITTITTMTRQMLALHRAQQESSQACFLQ
jgi:hypothetical protein